jgi:aldehyde dehydrogenase (NAD+)
MAGKTFNWAKNVDVEASIKIIRYYAGWADKNHGKTIDTDSNKLAYTLHEPFGVVGQIIPWNFPCMTLFHTTPHLYLFIYPDSVLMLCLKLGPALATGNAIVLKPSELTPLTAMIVTELINEAGFPPGSVNIVTGYGLTVGQAISEHMGIEKIAFTGSTLVGRKIMEASAKSNLKNVTLELGGKSPNIIFNDANFEQAVNWAIHGIL